MKTQRSKTKDTAVLPNLPTVAEPTATDTSGRMPTTEQLATLAVHLAKGIPENPVPYLDAALQFWEIADGMLHYPPPLILKDEVFFASGDARNGVVARDAFFKRLLPDYKKSRSAEIGECGKDFLRFLLRKLHQREPTTDEISELWGKWNAGTPEDANKLAHEFHQWYPERKRLSASIRGMRSQANRVLRKCLAIKSADRKLLLDGFGSIQTLNEATSEQLTDILRSKPKAEKVKSFLEEHAASAVEKKSKKEL